MQRLRSAIGRELLTYFSRTTLGIVLAVTGLRAADPQTGRLAALANEAIRNGKTEITLPGLLGYDALSFPSLAQALHFHIRPLVVTVGNKQSAVGDSERIFTWYIAHVVDKLTGADLPPVGTDSSQHVPATFQHLDKNFILIKTFGGTVLVNGVTIRTPEDPVLVTDHEYLLFVRFDDTALSARTRVAQLPIGDSGIYNYQSTTGRFTPAGTIRDAITSDIMRQTGGNLTTLRSVVSHASK